jgi:hypothetical protein
LFTYILPWRLARHVFRPASANAAEPFQRLSDARAFAGIIAVLVLSVPTTGGFGYALNERFSNVLIGFGACAVVALCVTGLYAIVRRHTLDADQRKAVRAVLLRSALPILIPAMFVLTLMFVSRNEPPPTGAGAVLFVLILLPLCTWSALLLLPMCYHCLRWAFGVGDVNPYLSPLVSTLSAAVAFKLDDFLPNYDIRPDGTQNLLKISALLSVIALSIVECTFLTTERRVARVTVPFLAGLAFTGAVLIALPNADIGKNEVMFQTGEWTVMLDQLEPVEGGVRADVTYRNNLSIPRRITCSVGAVTSALVFATETVEMTDGRCVSAKRTITSIEPGGKFTTWAFFPTTRHRGEKVAIRWGNLGTTASDFVMPS